jgi:hypothetical protein
MPPSATDSQTALVRGIVSRVAPTSLSSPRSLLSTGAGTSPKLRANETAKATAYPNGTTVEGKKEQRPKADAGHREWAP